MTRGSVLLMAWARKPGRLFIAYGDWIRYHRALAAFIEKLEFLTPI